MKKFILLFMILAAVFLPGCKKHADNWVGFYYPDGAPDVGKTTCEINEFETKDKCEEWGMEKTKENGVSEYYCGYRCVYDSTCQYAC